jgi:molecular chaperone IbpA
MQRLLNAATARTEATYPPYNIETDGENAYRVTVAAAGFGRDELDVTVENDTLAISGKKAGETESADYLHRGLAGRDFQLKFNLADHIKITGANLENGLLIIDLEREIPEALKPRQIEIKTHPVKALTNKAKKMIGADNKAA